ncbi:MAG: restriction endonuclease [Methylococcales bacterium]
MKSVFNWIFKNAWNLFGVIGVAGTFYFSLMHVPDYVKDITTGKVNVIHESLMDDVQELIFYEKDISIDNIKSFIRGKELKQGVSYPYTPEELLVQVQERFMGNKFIPLEKRDSILKAISKVRSEYTPLKNQEKKPFDWTSLISWLFSGLGVAIAFAGATSIVKKLKMDQETEADIVAGNIVVNNYSGVMTSAAFEYEKMVGDVLSELGLLNTVTSQNQDIGYDYLAKIKEKEFIVEVKKYRKLLGLSTAREFLHKVIESGKGGILVVSSGITKRTKDLIIEHNKITDTQNIYLVIGDSKESVKSQLTKLFDANASNNRIKAEF